MADAQLAVTVLCDDARHPQHRPRVFVAEFVREGVVWWPQAQRRKVPTVRWWVSAEGGITRAPGLDDERGTLSHVMWCAYCGEARPLSVRVGKLDATLDQLVDVRRGVVTLSELRAILEMSGR